MSDLSLRPVTPENTSLAMAKMTCSEYGWREGMPIDAWIDRLRWRRDLDALLHDRFFLASAIRLIEATPDEFDLEAQRKAFVNRKKTAEEKAAHGRLGTPAPIVRDQLIAARCKEWRRILSQPMNPSGAGNNLGVTAMTVLRAMETLRLTMRDIELQWLGARGIDPKTLREVMNGRRRISQRHAEMIVKHFQPEPADEVWYGSSA